MCPRARVCLTSVQGEITWMIFINRQRACAPEVRLLRFIPNKNTCFQGGVWPTQDHDFRPRKCAKAIMCGKTHDKDCKCGLIYSGLFTFRLLQWNVSSDIRGDAPYSLDRYACEWLYWKIWCFLLKLCRCTRHRSVNYAWCLWNSGVFISKWIKPAEGR